jgi:peptidoglycan lytic transglycosylase G
MIDREVQVPSERRLVAEVIYNRLEAGEPLGIDATIRYATGNWTRPLTRSELGLDSPYNTRTRAGLPPTPIGNPGLASIEAAARPARVGYMYYVVKPGTCGEHAFSTTFAQFEQDQRRYNEARDAAGGKSPTTC